MSIKDAEQYAVKGDLKAAEIELRNAIREAPQDPVLRARLADVYLKLADPAAAEREARAALERNGDEVDYLPVLASALLYQEKFADLLNLVKPGNRSAPLESEVRTALGTAEAGLRDRDKAEDLLRAAVKLDSAAVRPKIQLARLLADTNPEEADRFIDEVIAADPRSAEALQVKGEMLRSRGDPDGAVRLFDRALTIDPNNLLAHLSRANLSITLGQYKLADEDLDPILKSAPNNIMANYLRGLERAKMQDYAAADRIFDRISPAFSVHWSGYYLQGATKLALGQSAQAEAILAKYLTRVPDDPRAARLIASAALQQRSPSRAIGYLKSIVDRVPADAATLTLLGNAYMAEGKPELALQQFEKAAALDPDNLAIKTRVGISEIEIWQGQRGVSTLEQAFATEAGAPVAGPTLLLTEVRAKHLDKAAEVAESLVKKDPDNPVYSTLLGIVRIAQRDYAAAEKSFRSALAINPEFPAATCDLAQLYAVTGRIEDAKRLYSDLLAQKADDVTALLGLSDIFISEKSWPEANDAINRARSAATNDPSPGLKLVGLYSSREDWKSAMSVAAELAARFPGDVNVLEAQARAEYGAGDMDGAVSSYKRAHELAPNSIPILSRYLSLLHDSKYFVEARGVLQDALGRDPKNSQLKGDLVRVEAEVDGLEAGLAKARAFAQADPGNPAYDLVSAELLEKAGRSGDAAISLEKAVVARPSEDSLIAALARLYARTGKLAKAEAVLKTRLRMEPDDSVIRSKLASIYLEQHKYDNAIDEYTRVAADRRADSAALNNLAWLYQQKGDLVKARELAERAAAGAPENPQIDDTLGWILLGQGDVQKALPLLSAASMSAPGNPDIQYHLAVALHRVGRLADARTTLEKLLGSGSSFSEKAEAEKLLQELKGS